MKAPPWLVLSGYIFNIVPPNDFFVKHFPNYVSLDYKTLFLVDDF